MTASSTSNLIDPADKRVATLRARCALRGVVLSVLSDDCGQPEYIVTQGAWTRAFSRVDELSAWVDRIEGRRPT